VIAHIYEIPGIPDIQTVAASYIKQHNLHSVSLVPVLPADEKTELTVEQIRDVRKQLTYQYDQTVIVLFQWVDRSGSEVQNMLLKLLEEHQPTVHLILVVQSIHSLVPPIISRCKIIQSKEARNGVGAVAAIDPQSKLTVADVDSYIVSLIPQSPSMKVLSYLLHQRQLLLYNNLSPQSVYDGILIFMKKVSTMST
jgi:hypothetical protein